MKPYSNQDYHDEITWFFDTYYAVKKASENGDPIPVKDRIANADELIEQYVEQHGQRPPNAILSRLATYILLDTLSDSHPDKMSREEYPIMSRNQAGLRRERERSLADVYTGKNDETIGRYRDEDGVKRRLYDYMTPKRSEFLVPLKYLDLYNAMDKANLTKRQRQTVDLVYFEGMTQEDTAKEMGIHRANVNLYLRNAYDKIRRGLGE